MKFIFILWLNVYCNYYIKSKKKKSYLLVCIVKTNCLSYIKNSSSKSNNKMNNLLLSLILLIACVGEWKYVSYFIKLIVFIIGSASATSCYYCSNCPTPFNPYSISVTKVASYTGYCLVRILYFIDWLNHVSLFYITEKKQLWVWWCSS